MSHSAEAARAAVLTAEFNEKRWVWVPDEKEGYLAAWVIREDDDVAEVMLAGGGEVRHFRTSNIEPHVSMLGELMSTTYLNAM